VAAPRLRHLFPLADRKREEVNAAVTSSGQRKAWSTSSCRPPTFAVDIKRLETERADIDARLAAIEESDNVITLHPAALDRYRADIDRPAALLPRADIGIGSELEDSIRTLVSTMIVHTPANR
jgi:hypothetical protein